MMRPGQQSIFLSSAAMASLAASDVYEATKVSTKVLSQTRHWPDIHDYWVAYNLVCIGK